MLAYFIYSGVMIIVLLIIKRVFNGPKTQLAHSMAGQTIIVTGSNSGIGSVTADELVKQGARVIYANRDEEKTMKVIGSLDERYRDRAIFMKLDLADFQSILEFTENFKRNFSRLDILINNAGATYDTFGLKENIEKTTMTNHIGPVCLTNLLIDIINPKGRIIMVSSRGHKRVKVKDLNYLYQTDDFSHMRRSYSHLKLYCLSKMGNVYYARHLAKYFNANNIPIKTACLHPGLVNTEIFNISRMDTIFKKFVMILTAPVLYLIGKTKYMGAQTTLHIAYMDWDDLHSGDYFNNCHPEQLSELATSQDKIKEFMEFTKMQIKKNWTNAPDRVFDYLD